MNNINSKTTSSDFSYYDYVLKVIGEKKVGNFNKFKFTEMPRHKEWNNPPIRNNYNVYESNFEDSDIKQDLPKPYLLIGFDTEYQTRDMLVSEVKDKDDKTDIDEEILLNHQNKVFRYKYLRNKGKLLNNLLSYQTHCIIIIPKFDDNGNYTHSEKSKYEWECIVHPNNTEWMNKDNRLSLAQLLHYTMAKGIVKYPNIKIPTDCYLLSHFSRADIPSLRDYQWDESDLIDGLMNIRGVFTGRKDIKVNLIENVTLKVKLRDTINLAPTLKKSLNDIGMMLEFPKMKLGKNDKEEKHIKENMKEFMFNDYKKFKEYGILDAKITTQYAYELLQINMRETGKYNIPRTLTSMAVKKLINMWKEEDWITEDKPQLQVCGKKIVTYKRYSNKLLKYTKVKKITYVDKVNWRVDFVSNTYHGGRNEQFIFGASWIDDWSDWDLRSAYATAMCMIGKPNWDKTKTIYNDELLWKLDIDDLAFCQVDFEFPSSVRYPCLPVRGGEQGLIFPMKGNSLCGLQELKLAKELGADLTLHEAVTVETDKNVRIFEKFISYCYKQRQQAIKKEGKGSLSNHFWKEMSNSTYGKTAQGLRVRKVYDLTNMDMKQLQESEITNPFFASFITSMVRASLAEIMNKLPKDKCVFSVTTDGFLTNANEEEISKTLDGEVCLALTRQIKRLGNETSILEIKHKCNQAIGWRTRGQATLKEYGEWKDEKGKDKSREDKIVLAKSGIKLPTDNYEKWEENEEMVKLFLNRKWDDKLIYSNLSGIREMREFKIDLTPKPVLRNLSMEYDWKRQPSYTKDVKVGFDNKEYTHIYMETKPWKSLEEFTLLRNKLDEFKMNNSKERVIRSVDDYTNLLNFLGSKLSLPKKHQVGLSKTNTEEKRLKQRVLCAWRKRQGGMIKCFIPQRIDEDTIVDKEVWKITLHYWKIIFKTIGIEITNHDFWNSKTQPREYIPHTIPKSQKTEEMLYKLKQNHFPYLKIDELLSNEKTVNLLHKDEEETQFLNDNSRIFKDSNPQ